MKKYFLVASAILIFILITGTLLWYGGALRPTNSSNPDVVAEGDKTPDSETGNATLPPLPAEYARLRENNPNMRPDRREAYFNKFNEVIAVIQEHPDSLIAWNELGAVKDAFDDHKGAEEAWLYALEIAPNYTAVYNNLAQLYWRDLRDISKAEKMFLKFLEFDSTATYIWRDLSDLYRYDYKNMTKAETTLLSGLEKNKNDPDLLSYLASYYATSGQPARAISYYEQLIQVSPSNEAARKDLEDLKAGRSIGSPN